MTTEQIKQLLEKYWAGDTSIDEEVSLKTFFSEDSIPEELIKYQPLFVWKNKQLLLKGGKELYFEFEKPLKMQLYSFLKVAASVLLALT